VDLDFYIKFLWFCPLLILVLFYALTERTPAIIYTGKTSMVIFLSFVFRRS